ncbi:hypothetical protein LOAG_15361, partial [Loa loa]
DLEKNESSTSCDCCHLKLRNSLVSAMDDDDDDDWMVWVFVCPYWCGGECDISGEPSLLLSSSSSSSTVDGLFDD